MAKVTVHHDRLTRYSSIGMMLLGLFALLFVSGLIGIILIVVGYIMYRYYRRQAKASRVLGGQVEKGASF